MTCRFNRCELCNHRVQHIDPDRQRAVDAIAAAAKRVLESQLAAAAKRVVESRGHWKDVDALEQVLMTLVNHQA